MNCQEFFEPYTRQRGSALIISMVLLLLLMLAAVGSLSSSIVQERMAHNISQLHESFQAAETGLRYVEQQVRADGLALPTAECSPGACDVAPAVLTSSEAPGMDWSEVPAGFAGDDSRIWYRVVRLGDSMLPVNQAAGAASTLYRVSVISQRHTTRTLLEGVYAFTRI